MKKISIIIMLVLINITTTAQTKSQIEEVLKKIELEKFDNQSAFEMGLAIIDFAKKNSD